MGSYTALNVGLHLIVDMCWCTILLPDITTYAIGGIQDGEDLVDEHLLVLGNIQGGLNPGLGKCLSI